MFRAKLKTDKTVQAAVSGSGDIVSFESAFEKPLADLILNITPAQSGEGDPSPTNIRPISGWTGANVYLSPTEDDADATVYPVTWSDTAGTVYGGTLDVVRGKLTRKYRLITPTGTGTVSSGNTFSKGSSTSYNVYYTLSSDNAFLVSMVQKSTTLYPNTICSHFPLGSQTTANSFCIGSRQPRVVLPKDDKRNTAALFNAWVKEQYDNGTPLQILAPLVASAQTTYDLDPVTINTLLGQNNVWADCGEVENLRLDAVSGKLKFKLIQ